MIEGTGPNSSRADQNSRWAAISRFYSTVYDHQAVGDCFSDDVGQNHRRSPISSGRSEFTHGDFHLLDTNRLGKAVMQR